jgi:hypothetical protein
VNSLVDTGMKYDIEINIEKPQVRRVSRSNELLKFKVINRELKEVDVFTHLGSVSTGDGYGSRKMERGITMAKEAFNRKLSLLTSNLNIELWKKLIICYVWSIALYGSEIWTLRKLGRKYLESFEMSYWRKM